MKQFIYFLFLSIFIALNIGCTVNEKALSNELSDTSVNAAIPEDDSKRIVEPQDGNEVKNDAEKAIISLENDNVQPDKAQNTLYSTPLSLVVYPEWINLTENHHTFSKMYSPIDHDYNIRASNQDFIGDAADEFEDIWMQELEYQYNQCLKIMPEEFKDQFIKQQSAWLEYHKNDVFNYIGGSRGWGYIREWKLISMNRIRERTLDIMRVVFLIGGTDVEFNYGSIESE